MKHTLLCMVLAGFCISACRAQVPGPEAAAALRLYGDSARFRDAAFLFDAGWAESYAGNDRIGNEIMWYALALKDTVTGEDYRELSVQNTKNGRYREALDALEKAVSADASENGYYGWVLLYYYHDYRKALSCLERYDALTPGFSDAPVGEDIHFLKGQCYMQLGEPENAVSEFDIYIGETTRSHGEEWVDVYTFVYKAHCLQRLGRREEALFWYDKAIACYPSCTDAFYYKASVLAENGEFETACGHLARAEELARQRYFHGDVYVELFLAVYPQDIEKAVARYCRGGR